MKVLTVRFSNGRRFRIPAEVIAKHRANYYANREEDTEFADELEYGLSDEYVLIDWASNNMNWDDVKDEATEIEPDECEKRDEWTNAEKEVREV